MTFKPDSSLALRVQPSPNHGERKAGRAIDSIILHYTGMPTGAAALQRLCEEAAQVSAHYFVEEDGTILQLVPEARRAWHAGVSCWKGETDLNSSSIGIEIVNPGHDGGLPEFPATQIDAVVRLCRNIALRHKIRHERILAHSDIAPGRKIDPGEKFPWSVLSENGVGHWVTPASIIVGARLALGDKGPAIASLRADLMRYGYHIAPGDIFDAPTQTVVAAFQLHFRPDLVDGIADASTQDTLRRLIGALPYSAATT